MGVLIQLFLLLGEKAQGPSANSHYLSPPEQITRAPVVGKIRVPVVRGFAAEATGPWALWL